MSKIGDADRADIIFDNVTVYEGTFVTQRYTVDSSDADQRFVINDNRVDTRTLSVQVQNSSSDSTQTTYTNTHRTRLSTTATRLESL